MKRYRLLSYCFLIGLFVFCSNVVAESPGFKLTTPASAPTLTLKEAIFLALRYNQQVRDGEIQRVVDKFNLRAQKYAFELQYALTGGLTYANATSGGTHSESTNYNLAPAVSYTTPLGTVIKISENNPIAHTASRASFFNPGVTAVITQPLLRGYGPAVVLAPLYNAYDTELAARLTMRNTVISTITLVITNYTALIQALNTLITLQQALKTTLTTLNEYKAEIKAGRRAPADTMQFQLNVAQQQQAIEAQLITIQQARFTLLQTLGLDPTTMLNVSKEVKLDDSNLPNLQQSIELALKNNIPYQQALLGFRGLQRNLLVQKDNQRWQLNATFTQTFGNGSGGAPNSGFQSLVNGQDKSTNINLALTVPIHDINLQQGLVNAKAALDKAAIDLAVLKRGVITGAVNAYNNLQSQKAQIVQAQDAVKYANLSLSNANVRLNYGRATPFEVATLQNDLTTAQLGLINTEINYVNALSGFEQVIGITLDRWKIKLRF